MEGPLDAYFSLGDNSPVRGAGHATEIPNPAQEEQAKTPPSDHDASDLTELSDNGEPAPIKGGKPQQSVKGSQQLGGSGSGYLKRDAPGEVDNDIKVKKRKVIRA